MALDATQRRQRREQDVSDGPGCHPRITLIPEISLVGEQDGEVSHKSTHNSNTVYTCTGIIELYGSTYLSCYQNNSLFIPYTCM